MVFLALSTIGYLRAIIGHLRAIIGHFIGHSRIWGAQLVKPDDVLYLLTVSCPVAQW